MGFELSFLTTFFFAYLDPGSGSFILQILIAGFLGFMLSAKIFWTRLMAFFTGSKPNKTTDTDEDQNAAS